MIRVVDENTGIAQFSLSPHQLMEFCKFGEHHYSILDGPPQDAAFISLHFDLVSSKITIMFESAEVERVDDGLPLKEYFFNVKRND